MGEIVDSKLVSVFGEDVSLPEEVEQRNQFEQQYADEILPFVNKKGHASCTEWMKEFKITYTAAVKFMDALEERGIVDVGEHNQGPRPLLNGRKKKCPNLTPITSSESPLHLTSPLPPTPPTSSEPTAPSPTMSSTSPSKKKKRK